ncbi:MAG: hypothetical protein RIS47_1704 [Bacteroidota bacterium]|jgi:polyphosphate glucokinase
MEVLGIDIGGSGIKGAIVNVETGELVGERFRVETPQPASPEAVFEAILQLTTHFKWTGKVGLGFPGVVRSGVIKTAANLDKAWVGVNAAEAFKALSGLDSYWVNDADAAGVAEVKFGSLAQDKNVVIFLTIGTGIGSAIFTQGHLLPNTEFGHLKLKNETEAEHYASDAARKREDMSWEKWGKRINKYLETMDALFWPDLFIIGGGISKKFDKYADKFTLNAPVLPASLLNEAGAIGAAYFAAEQLG